MGNLSERIKYVGVFDNRIDLFEGQYSVPDGISYNSYLIDDEKRAVIDSVEHSFAEEWIENIRRELSGGAPDYLVIQHMEPDHSSGILKFLEAFPEAVVVSSKKAFSMMKGFFATEFEERRIVVGEGDTLPLGEHTLKFIAAPMVHWPEVMVSYEEREGILFSADGFGRFGRPIEDDNWADEARRYYIGIVGKYGQQVQALLKKAAALDIKAILPLHGPALTRDIGRYIALYDTWSSYRAEERGVLIAYCSVYGNTKRACEILKRSLEEKGVKCVALDLSRADMSLAVAEAFRYSALVLASTTYNMGVFPYMREFIHHLTERGYKNRTVSFVENGSWAPNAKKVMEGLLEGSVGLSFTEKTVKITSALNEESKLAIEELSKEISEKI